jgi:hypothetical protein
MPRPFRKRIILECFQCKKLFERTPWEHEQSKKRKTKKIFCSMECYSNERSENHGSGWKGGRSIQKGYVMLWCSDGKRRLEHRLIMEKHLKRSLTKHECVHHINGIRSDNRIENLVVCKTHGEHTSKYHPLKRLKGKFHD